MELVEEIYKITKRFPIEEKFGLISQMRRAAIAIPSNIAEGRRRGTRKDFRQFLVIAYSSGAELETQSEIAQRLKMAEVDDFEKIDTLLAEIMKMLNKMLLSLIK